MSRESRTDGPREGKPKLWDRLLQRRQARKQRKAERARLARENPVPPTTPGSLG
jgi:hypothetical protein